MAETARRNREAGGSDIVRRLIARPIRLDPPRAPAWSAGAAYAFDRTTSDTDAEFVHAIADPDLEAALEAEDDGADDDVVERLQAEMALMKAILMAERAEAASLRARIVASHEPEPEPIGAEARATRDRWAGMVDRLLLSAR